MIRQLSQDKMKPLIEKNLCKNFQAHMIHCRKNCMMPKEEEAVLNIIKNWVFVEFKTTSGGSGEQPLLSDEFKYELIPQLFDDKGTLMPSAVTMEWKNLTYDGFFASNTKFTC